MKISSFVVGSLLVAIGIFGTVSSTQAYEAKAITLSPTHTLFVTTYSETLLNRDGIIPMSAKIGAEGTHTPLVATFQVAGKNKIAFTGKNLGSLILSDQTIVHDGYKLSKGAKSTLMLITLIEHDRPLTSDVHASLTSLPILLTTNGEIDSKTIKTY